MIIDTRRIEGWSGLTDPEYDYQKAALKPFFAKSVRLRKGGETMHYFDAVVSDLKAHGGLGLGRGHVIYRLLPLIRALSGGGRSNVFDSAVIRSASMRIAYALRGFDSEVSDERSYRDAKLHPAIAEAIDTIQVANERHLIRATAGAIDAENSGLLHCPVGRLLTAQCKCSVIRWDAEAAGFGILARACLRGIWPMGYIASVDGPDEEDSGVSADEDKMFFLVGDGPVLPR